ncbi:DUF6452 family protein [Chitinophaga solisilvae]|uniref:Lipoprotein n=1 Tax=Chitinophaga solisilvae TaxID=1233460 RepID=A0A9Q5D140_9BACT|nr:DUF6452 family protein [Chitinophaga solisilvae]NSL88873.1 hypothetical protein [Chitinophaga solisilvae]
MKTIYQILLPCLLLAGIVACENETKICDQTLRTELRIAFKKKPDNFNRIRDTVLPKVTLFAIDQGKNRDSIFKKAPLSSVFLPLSPVADSSIFFLQVDSTAVPDTLTFRYTRSKHFISPGCGFGTYFFLDTMLATKHRIDSIAFNSKSVINSNDTHLTFFFAE